MTANTPPTPPAARERRLDRVCFEASTTSCLTSSAEDIEGVEEEEEEEEEAITAKDLQYKIPVGKKGARCDVEAGED